MNDVTWTPTQMQRLTELDVDLQTVRADFSTPVERNRVFQQIEKAMVKKEREKLSDILVRGIKTRRRSLTEKLQRVLAQEGFVQVKTPTIITKAALAKMTIDETHPLFRQVYWINKKQCLRPMLAPNLYSLMIDFSRLNHRPIRFYEMGSCFRRESDGARHNSEFTMLNLVEMGLPEKQCYPRLKEVADMIATASGLTDHSFETEDSRVYGTTLDVVAGPDNIEVASGTVGPHPLDAAWGITEPWVGIGFGIERLLMTSAKDRTIGKWGRSLSYLDGIRLRI